MSKFSELDLDRQLLDAVSVAMQEPEETAEIQIERRADFIIRELDEFCRLATNAETVDLIDRERIAIGQIVTRSQLIASFLTARQPSKLRIVR
jgi:hypothetical protein